MGHLLGSMDIHQAISQLLLPHRVLLRGQIRHGEHAVGFVLTQHSRNGLRQMLGRKAQPSHFVAVTLDRRFPQRRHFELRQGTFEAKALSGCVNPHDERGHAAGQRCERHLFMGQQQTHALQGCDQLGMGFRQGDKPYQETANF